MIKSARMPSGNEIPTWGLPIKINGVAGNATLGVPGFNQHRKEILEEIGLSSEKDS